MSRRYASWQPGDVLTDDELLLAHYGERTRAEHRPMPGCRERCCFPQLCPGRLPAELTPAIARLEWQLSGFDLVPIASAVLGWAAAVVTVARTVGGWL